MVPMWFVRAVLIFKRGSIADKVGFNRWIDKEWDKSSQTALGVYPEGHRSTTGKSLPLKRGMLHYAYDRNIPVQIVIGGNKESILSEKKMVVGFGRTVWVGYSDVIFPGEYKDFEEFMKMVQKTWDGEWKEVMEFDKSKLSVLQELEEPVPYRTVDPVNYVKLMVVCPLEIGLFGWCMRWLILSCLGGLWNWLGTFGGSWDIIVSGIVFAWVFGSFRMSWAASPLDADEKKVE